jgi:hypothetical protein
MRSQVERKYFRKKNIVFRLRNDGEKTVIEFDKIADDDAYRLLKDLDDAVDHILISVNVFKRKLMDIMYARSVDATAVRLLESELEFMHNFLFARARNTLKLFKEALDIREQEAVEEFRQLLNRFAEDVLKPYCEEKSKDIEDKSWREKVVNDCIRYYLDLLITWRYNTEDIVHELVVKYRKD